jgi:hypothetical protein
MAIDKTKHKASCACIADESKACDCGGITPETDKRNCWDCGATVGKSEKTCPNDKCNADLEVADQEDGVVDRAIARLKKKRKAELQKPPEKKDEPGKKKSIFSSLNKIVK